MTLNLPSLIAVVLGGGALLSYAVIRLLRWYRAREYNRRLLEAVTSLGSDYRRDVVIADGNGATLHIDFLLLTARGILLVDLRDLEGNVFGSDQMSEWTVMSGARRFTFPNPQAALYDKVAAVKSIALETPVEGRVAFSSSAQFPKGVPRSVTKIDQLATEFPPMQGDALGMATAAHSEAWIRVLDKLAPSPLRKPTPI